MRSLVGGLLLLLMPSTCLTAASAAAGVSPSRPHAAEEGPLQLDKQDMQQRYKNGSYAT